MQDISKQDTQKKPGLSAGAVGVGLAGAAAGAAVGIAMQDQRVRQKVFRLAREAQSSLTKLLEALDAAQDDVAEKGMKKLTKVKKSMK